MNVYDKAYELKRALMESTEVKDYTAALEKVTANPASKKMLDDFREKQIEIQSIQFSGGQIDKEKVEQLERLYGIISLNSDINYFLQQEYRFSVLMNDISKIISEAFDIGYKLDDKTKSAL